MNRARPGRPSARVRRSAGRRLVNDSGAIRELVSNRPVVTIRLDAHRNCAVYVRGREFGDDGELAQAGKAVSSLDGD